jgi:hypothetical protein
MSNTKKVFSSYIEEIGHDEMTGELMVKFTSGKTAVYSGVSERTAKDVMDAPSVGEALHSQIRGQYAHKYI